jgi:hypothetical protein
MRTLSTLIQSDLDADLSALAADLDVPVVAGLQHQGDVSVVPVSMLKGPATGVVGKQVPREGVAVVRGEAGGNTHLLLAAGKVHFHAATTRTSNDIDLGYLMVAEGATAWLDHAEHGNTGIAPGEYMIRRKREQADMVRFVAD